MSDKNLKRLEMLKTMINLKNLFDEEKKNDFLKKFNLNQQYNFLE